METVVSVVFWIVKRMPVSGSSVVKEDYSLLF